MCKAVWRLRGSRQVTNWYSIGERLGRTTEVAMASASVRRSTSSLDLGCITPSRKHKRFFMILEEAPLSALSATVMTGRQCCRHVGTASAACSANVPHLRTTLWTSVLGCGVLLRSLSNQTPRSPCRGPLHNGNTIQSDSPPASLLTGERCRSPGRRRQAHFVHRLHHLHAVRASAPRPVSVSSHEVGSPQSLS